MAAMANLTIGTPMPTHPQCGTCKTEQGLVRCQACQVIFYCGRNHQASDWPQHKQTCTPIKKTRNKVATEVDLLNAMPDSWMFRAKPFENSVGHFWGIVDTRDYMRARYDHVEALLKIKNRTAVQTALDHLRDMLRLNRSDNMGLRDLVPALYLRLDREQACYDFIKWWCTSGTESDYDWGNTDLPHLDIENADAFEPPNTLNMKYAALPHRAMLCLLKWHLQPDLRTLKNASIAAGDKVPAELLNGIRSHMLNPAAQNNTSLIRDVENGRDIGGHIIQLGEQVDALFDALNGSNKYYWAAVVEPGSHLTARPPSYSQGTVSEMQLALAQTYDAWAETPGAIGWVKSKVSA
jgi:hypothetical protein